MDSLHLSRELLVADIVLSRGLASAPAVATALQRYWAVRDREAKSFVDVLAQSTGLDTAIIESIRVEAERLASEAGGDARRALAQRGRVDQAIGLTLGAQPGPRRAAGESTQSQASSEELRRASEGRFSNCLIAGKGGMGVVYMAFDRELSRFVALKMIRPPRSDGTMGDAPLSPFDVEPFALDPSDSGPYTELKQRFLQEAWITGGLEHPGIVPVYELGQTPQGVPFYTMRFISGHRTLATAIEEVRDGGLAARLALLEPFLKICDAVQYAHARGVVHRDLKPANIALGSYGEVLVLDWGLAKVDGEDGDDRRPWVNRVREFRTEVRFETQFAAIGTPGYMAPEAATGDGAAVHARSDVYSLGAILYEILTGRLPHIFDTWTEWIRKLVDEAVEEPARFDPSIPAGLSSIAVGALAREQDERPASAADLARSIRAWQLADTEARELDRMERDAREAIHHAESARADERLRSATRAVLLIRQVGKRRPQSEAALALAGEADRLRQLGLRERTWQVVRRPLVAAAVLFVAVVLTIYLVDRSTREEQLAAIDSRFDRAEILLGDDRPDSAVSMAEEGLRLLVEAERDGIAKMDTSVALRRRHVELICRANVQKGDVKGVAMAAVDALSFARSTEEWSGYQLLAAQALARLGVFSGVRGLLRDSLLPSMESRRLLLDALLRVGDRAGAERLAKQIGDRTSLSLLKRYRVLTRIPIKGACDVAAVPLGEKTVLAIVTSGGEVFRWTAEDPHPARIGSVHGERYTGIYPSGPGRVTLIGSRDSESGGAPWSVIQNMDIRTGDVQVLRQERESTPRGRRIDLDGDGQREFVLLFGAQSRGVEVLEPSGESWSAERMGDLGDLKSDRHPRVDVQDAVLVPGADGRGDILLLGTGGWNTKRLGFGVVAYRFGGPKRTLRQFEHRRLGSVDGLECVDLDGDGSVEVYAWNSYYAVPEQASVRKQFAPLGVYELDPEDLSLDPIRVVRASGFYLNSEGLLKTSPIHWNFNVRGETRIRPGKAAILYRVYVNGLTVESGRTFLELLFSEGGQIRSWVLPDVHPFSASTMCCSGDIIPEAVGQEIAVVCSDEVVVLGDAEGAAKPDHAARRAPANGGDAVFSMAAGLRSAGYPGIAAEVYEACGSPMESRERRSQRWIRAAECWMEDRDADRARTALSNASRQNGLSPIQRLMWEGRIAAQDHRMDDARAAYDYAAQALATELVREDLERRVGTDKARLIAEEIVSARKRIGAPSTRWSSHVRFPSAPTNSAALPVTWRSSRPCIALRSEDGRGVEMTLHGQRDDFVGFVIQTDEPRAFRLRVRLTVEEQAWGSQLALGFGQSSGLGRVPRNVPADATWIALVRGGGMPRGVNVGLREGRSYRSLSLREGGGYLWKWGRPLELELSYRRELAEVRLVCRDAISGEVLAKCVLPTTRPLVAGEYYIGLWGTPRRNVYNQGTCFILHELRSEVTSDGSERPHIVPPPTADASSQVFREGWDLWRGGNTRRAAELLTSRIPSRALAELLVGPRPQTPIDLVEACLDASGGRALYREMMGSTVDDLLLIGLDEPLLAGLYLRGRLVEPDGELRESIADALERTGHLAEAWPLLKKEKRPSSTDLSPVERLRRARAFYEDGEQLEVFLRNLLDGEAGEASHWAALIRCVEGAIVRGEKEAALAYLGKLLSAPGFEPESLNDNPAIRRLLSQR